MGDLNRNIRRHRENILDQDFSVSPPVISAERTNVHDDRELMVICSSEVFLNFRQVFEIAEVHSGIGKLQFNALHI